MEIIERWLRRLSWYTLIIFESHTTLPAFPSKAACVKTDGMLDIFSTPSNSPYLRGEPISFCSRQFPSPSIGGRVRDGGHYSLNKPFSHSLSIWNEKWLEFRNEEQIVNFPSWIHGIWLFYFAEQDIAFDKNWQTTHNLSFNNQHYLRSNLNE